ncbi:AAA family ATPase [Actinoplanes sp. RD1]|uniref:AAA family ATPase n=1 Tax=Actinoplanes sp. RD1 TaxID=3064538 RepID=UPI00274067C4|nr:ATP-binding protein [Actinoplanes sp. RD1]
MTTLGQRLGELRRRAFTGRDEELALFRAALSGSGVLFVHGPGGVGKSSLLDRFAELAAGAGRELLRADARDGTQLPTPEGDRPVLLIDTYELLSPVDDWVREHYLPALPGDSLIVLAGRQAPRWAADPGWRELLTVVPLGNLSPEDGAAYLAAQGVPSALRDTLLALGHGHPLTLSMLVEAVRRGAEARTLSDLPDVVSALLARTVDATPTPRHRRALEVCAHLPVTTEELLRPVTGDDAGELFAWLRTLSFVEEGPYGLYPHDVVRDALDADLRWRDPGRYAELHRELSGAVLARIRATADRGERLRLITGSIVLAGGRSRVETCTTPPPTFQAYVDDLRPADGPAIVAMTRRWQGAEQARHAEYWLGRDPAAFRVFRAPSGEARGYAACLTLEGSSADPAAEAMWRYAQEQAPPRPGEVIRAWRFFLDRDHGQRPSPSTTLFAACQTLDILTTTGVAWTLNGAYADAGQWGPTMDNLDFWHAFDGVPHPVFAHDWRRVDVTEWMTVVQARQDGLPTRATAADAGAVVLSRAEFDAAVRAALRDLDHNPLLGTRLVPLRELVEEAAATLPPALHDLVDRTFLHPVTTQERVAETLHLSFNTYRRHRDQAVARITDWLWARS